MRHLLPRKLKEIPIPSAAPQPPRTFFGFHPPTSNTVYTPNQFFDVCLPHASRGCVRLVGHVIRRVLGWSDAEGNPLEERVAVSYTDLVDHAGISRDMIRAALDEAVERGFLTCVREGRPKRAGDAGATALYELRWDESGEYVRDPRTFRGFFAGEGNRTYIPNQFFDEVLRSESLSVVRVVGSVIRHSIGFQSKHGFRRQHARLSYSAMRRYAGIQSTSTLAAAIDSAIDRNYIVKVQQGVFTPDLQNQITTTYSLRWSDFKASQTIGRKTEAGSGPVHRTENRSSNGRIPEAENRSVKRSSIEITMKNNLYKQQAAGDGRSAVSEVISILVAQGLSPHEAAAVAKRYPEKLIRQQVEWLPLRHPRNPAGMLRLAIKEEWSAPVLPVPLPADSQSAMTFAAAYYAGYAGNDDALTAQPSAKEIEAATAYLHQILKMWPDPSRVESHGRRFGAFVREHKPPTQDFRCTFSVALRLFGDEFYKTLNQRRVAELNDRIAADRAAHEVQHAPSYWSFVAEQEARIRLAQPDRYAGFLAERERSRSFLLRNRFVLSEAHRQKQLARHDSDEDRLIAFHEAFAAEVPDFWEWDREHNGTPFGRSRAV